MKKYCFALIGFSLLVFALASTSYGWQGRMGGMGDPYGLLSDESDFLIHPAKIANGEGIKYYGDYRFTYTDVMDWDYGLDIFTPAGVLTESLSRETSGDEQGNEALLGAATPLGPGRFGIFFQYSGKRGEYNGDQMDFYPLLATSYYDYYDVQNDIDDFLLMLLYGLPLGGFKLGGEVQIAYRQEENKIRYNELLVAGGYALWTNYPWGSVTGDYLDFFPFLLPYDSQYWEALLKGSIEGAIGPVDVEFTLRGGFIFAGDNEYVYERQNPVGNPVERFDLDGDVEGWQIGGDLWVRYPLGDGLTLPFLVRVDYQSKTRDGDGPGLLGLTGNNYDYKNQERYFHIEAGGGVDKELDTNTRIVGGIYYAYLQGKNALWIMESLRGGFWQSYDHSDFPASIEHQVIVRFAGERQFTPSVALRMGLGFFYGWMREDFVFTYSDAVPFSYTDDISSDGYHWGIGGSVGGTFTFNNFTLEPFFNVGWQQFDVSGNGDSTSGGAIGQLLDIDLSRSEWYIGGGCSFLYDLP
jgi:hypothetical protein